MSMGIELNFQYEGDYFGNCIRKSRKRTIKEREKRYHHHFYRIVCGERENEKKRWKLVRVSERRREGESTIGM